MLTKKQRKLRRGPLATMNSHLFDTFSPTKLLTLTWLLTMLCLAKQGESNPVPEPNPSYSQGEAGNSSGGSSPYFYNSEKLLAGGPPRNSTRLAIPFPHSSPPSAAISAQQQYSEQPLVNPSELTFRLNRFCQADVSLERVICNNVRNRGDLPKKEKSFDGVQQAVFVNISKDGDLLLEDFRSLFPNLIALSITHSHCTGASLINLKSTESWRDWEEKATLVPKSLLSNPNFARRLNMNYYNTFEKPSISSLKEFGRGRGRGGRALFSEEASNNSTNLEQNTSGNKDGSPIVSPTSASEEGDDRESSSLSSSSSTFSSSEETNEILLRDSPQQSLEDEGENANRMPERAQSLRRFVWPSIRHLNFSWNELTSKALPQILGDMFPNLERLDLSNNFLTTLDKIKDAHWPRLKSIDISGNPLDCTNLDWVENPSIKLLHPNQTLCDQPPHQNKAKPIFKVLRLLKKVRDECRVNCSCDIAYIWEQNHIVHSKTVVNCSGRGFLDFPNPAHLPRPTDTLDLRNNSISSMSTFVDDHQYLDLHVMNLYLDDNKISSINILERSDWFYHFQVFSIRRNDLTEVPVYVLENVFRQNKRLLQMDLSSNKFKCDCSTISSFKVWLLKYTNNIGHIEEVRCTSTNEQIRYMRIEEWCKIDNGTQLLNVLDMVSIVLAFLIVVVISKVYYDYWNFKKKGRLPWIVSKM